MLEFKNFSLEYKNIDKENLKILDNINIKFEKGSINVITGESGCGKSSIIKVINGIIPEITEAKLSGNLKLDGKNLLDQDITQRSQIISTVFQNPKNQFYAVNSLDEIAFGLENRNVKKELIFEKIKAYTELLSTDKLLNKDLLKLSGGEKQLVAITSVACMDNLVYIFDEPSASLDQESIKKLAAAIEKLKKLGKIIIIAEHRLYYLKNILDKLCIIENKHLIYYNKNEINDLIIKKHGLRSLDSLSKKDLNLEKYWSKDLHDKSYNQNDLLKCLDFYCKFKDYKREIFNFNLSFNPGVYFIIGANGIGKTSFIRNLCGLNKKQKYKLFYRDKKIKNPGENISLVMQDVNYQLFTESVYSEISMVTDDNKLKEESLRFLGLWDKKDLHPQSLSGGEKQRLCLALCLASSKEIVVLDEPTSGLCLKNMQRLASLIWKMKEDGKTLIIISHDYEFIKLVDENIVEFVND